jgi:hypothetical protein
VKIALIITIMNTKLSVSRKAIDLTGKCFARGFPLASCRFIRLIRFIRRSSP